VDDIRRTGMTKQFFIACLPRTRSTWLANLFTTDHTFCHHEACTGVTLHAYEAMMKDNSFDSVGDCGSAIINEWVTINKQFPNAKWVFILRNENECVESYNRAFPDNQVTISDMEFMEQKMRLCLQAVAPRALCFTFKSLDSEESLLQMARHIGVPLNLSRFLLLKNFRVTKLAEKSLRETNPNVRKAILSVRKPDEFDIKYDSILKEISGNTDAYDWMVDAINLTTTQDHIIDGDKIDVQLMTNAFNNILLKWPSNQFYNSAKLLLTPVLANIICGWEFDNDFKQDDQSYKVYTDLPLAVAFLLGGKDYCDRFREGIFKTVADIKLRNRREG